jgi:electron transfer flavoprotein beta subunit
MKIAVCIKQVPASESKIKPGVAPNEIDWTGLSYVVNPYDEFAVEEALRIRERLGAGRVTVLSVGPPKVAEALRTCLAIGADAAVHVCDPALQGGDAYATALVLATALRRETYDLFLFGKQAIDDDAGAVGIHVAERLGLPHVAVINQLTLFLDEKRAVAHRQIEGGIEEVETPLPALFTCQKGLNEPRYASLPGIMKARQKPLTTLTIADLGLTPAQVGLAGSKNILTRLSSPPARSTGKMITSEPESAVAELLALLRAEKVL